MTESRWADRYRNDPRVWTHDHRPDYGVEFARRARLLARLRKDPEQCALVMEHYRHNPVDWILDWATTYDPRNSGGDLPTTMPFCLFLRQIDFIQFLHENVTEDENGLVEKCRDMGASYAALAYSVWSWVFQEGMAIGVGSRKADDVDKLGNPKSMFWKVRNMIEIIPHDLFWPKGFKPKEHMTHMRIENPANASTISGDSGDNIGRGGRTKYYLKDEAQPLDAKVLTPSGWSTMGDMVPGSKVIGPDGSRRVVTHINPCGHHDVYRVTFADGTSTEASTNHLWSLTKIIGKHKKVTITTEELFKTYRASYPSGQYHFIYANDVTKPVKFNSRGKLPLDPYVVGVLLGDGSIKDVPNYRPKFTSVDIDIANEVESRLPEFVTMTQCKDGKDFRLGDVDGRRGAGASKISRASQAIMAAGIAGYGAETKHIPERYKFSTIENRLLLLQGLMDTDGSAANGGFPTYHTCSRQLADDVRFLVQSLGGTASLNTRPDKRGYRDMYVIYMTLPDGMVPFKLPRKIEKLATRKVRMNKNVVNVEYVGRKEVKCITVDAADGLYLTDNCIVTHNSAHLERPELIEAALGDNTNVQIDISSVNGPGNVFHRRRLSGVEWEPGKRIPRGKTRVFVMDWRDHPAKDQAWYDRRRQKAEDEGLLHKFAQEVDRDYNSAVEGVLIPSAWVQAAIDSHIKLGIQPDGMFIAGQDVADSGGDVNALVIAQGFVVMMTDTDGREVDQAIPNHMSMAQMMGVREYQYEVTGVGTAPKVAAKDFERLRAIPWSPSGGVVNPSADDIGGTKPGDPDRMCNKDYFPNANSQAAWGLRLRFQRTYKAVVKGAEFEPHELISIPAGENQLIQELSQPTYSTPKGKIVIDKKPNGAKSPNLFDALKICYAPQQKKPEAPDYGTIAGVVGAGRVEYGVIG